MGVERLEAIGACRRTILPNGVRVITESMPDTRTVAIGVLVDVGPKDEPADLAGMSHFIEHLLFSGTATRGAAEIAQLIDTAGGHLGGLTTRDYTCIYALVLDDYRTYALDLLGDILLNSVFDEISVRREQEIARCEIQRKADAPEELAHQLLRQTVWPWSGLGRPIAGDPESIARLTPDRVRAFVREHYRADRIIVAAAGYLDHEDICAQVLDAMWRALPGGPRRPRTRPRFSPGLWAVHRNIQHSYFCLGLRAVPYGHEHRYAAHVLATLLGGGLSSRLVRSLRYERGIVYTVRASFDGYSEDGLIVVDGSTPAEHLETAIRLIQDQIEDLAEHGPSEHELWLAAEQIRGGLLLGAEAPSIRMMRMATQELYFGRRISDAEVLAAVRLVDASQVRELCASVLDREEIGLAVVSQERDQDVGRLMDHLRARTGRSAGNPVQAACWR